MAEHDPSELAVTTSETLKTMQGHVSDAERDVHHVKLRMSKVEASLADCTFRRGS